MQPIERYGVVALLFLMITIGAVVIWGPESDVAATAGHGTTAVREDSRTAPSNAVAERNLAAQQAREQKARDQRARDEQERAARQAKPPLANSSGSLRLASSDPVSGSAGRTAGVTPAVLAARAGSQPETQFLSNVPTTKAAKPPLAPESRPAAAATTKGAGTSTSSTAPALLGSARSSKATSDAARVYEIRPGDTLSEIALVELGTAGRWTEIRDLNPRVDPDRLQAGAKLLLPARGEVAARESVASAPDGHPTYRVAAGDTLSQIAERTLGTWRRWQEIATLNPGVDPNALREGQRLVLPAGAATVSVAASGGAGNARVAATPTTPKKRGGVR